jgi:pimeloyl-ACP methyl ester carboxylesterase
MQHFDSDGVRIAFLEEGEGDPILLIHGFASNARTNWVDTGWVNALVGDGRRVIAMDNRGHGASDKPHDTAVYEAPMMADDAYRLLQHLEIDQADVMGYSMGSRITAFLALAHPEQMRSMVFGGLGIGMVRGVGNSAPIAEALEAPDMEQVVDPVGRIFRSFAEATGSDLLALAACIRSARRKIRAEELAGVDISTLVAVGTKDEIAGSAQELAALIPGAKVLDIPDRDHMRAVGDRVYKQGVLDFLNGRE